MCCCPQWPAGLNPACPYIRQTHMFLSHKLFIIVFFFLRVIWVLSVFLILSFHFVFDFASNIKIHRPIWAIRIGFCLRKRICRSSMRNIQWKFYLYKVYAKSQRNCEPNCCCDRPWFEKKNTRKNYNASSRLTFGNGCLWRCWNAIK